LRSNYKKKLEIWGKAQRESTGALSPIGGKFSGESEIPHVTVTCPTQMH